MMRIPIAALVAGTLLIAACENVPPKPRAPSTGHLGSKPPAAPPADIPAPVMSTPFLPPPSPAAPAETFTVVVNEVPVKELLFALARDAEINIDVHPAIDGLVTMNAVDQSLDQILDRVARQVDVRYERQGDTLVITPDTPFLRTYTVDYVNLSRKTESTVTVATQVSTTGSGDVGGGGGGGGGSDNNSTTEVTTNSDNSFWSRLTATVQAIIQDERGSGGGSEDGKVTGTDNVIPNPEAGLIVVRATSRQHEKIRTYLDQVLVSVKRQVLIEATIVEVQLSDRYRAGIDFATLLGGGGVIAQQLLNAPLAVPRSGQFFVFEWANNVGNKREVEFTITALKEFGDVTVLSSPTIMALNNQTAIFKVVENRVFFTAESDTSQTESSILTTIETTPHTVPVGLVMAVTPHIDGADEVSLVVRPTITRAVGAGILDPNPNLALESRVPEIAVREMESVLKLRSGQVALLGGLMQDENSVDTDGVPFLSSLPDIGNLFKFRDDNFIKTELVIFLRPTVVRSASIDGDLRSFRRLLPENLQRAEELPVGAPGSDQ